MKREIQQILNGYAEEAATTDPGGAHRHRLVARLMDEHPEVADYGDALLHDALLTMAANAIKPKRSQTGQLPGLGDDIPLSVTVSDGEGEIVVKNLSFATIEDLRFDLDLHDKNVAAAIHARDLADRRNRRLIPIMEANGFDVAGKALLMLATEDAA